jgi:hypothetical protein
MQVGCSIFASQVQFFLREAACRADSLLYSTIAIPLLVLWPPSHHDAEDISAKRFVYKCQLAEPTSYEAESSQNTLSSGAKVIDCKGGVCSGGARVGDIGLNAGTVGTLQFSHVSKNVAGKYMLTMYSIIAGADKLTMYVSVNGGSAIVLLMYLQLPMGIQLEQLVLPSI